MNITLTNLGPVAVPYTSSKGEGFALLVKPHEEADTDDASITVAVVGEKPNFLDELKEAASALAEAVAKLLTFWREQSAEYLSDQDPVVQVRIENHGPNALRVILGDPTIDVQVDPGTTFDAEVDAYVEIRELGV